MRRLDRRDGVAEVAHRVASDLGEVGHVDPRVVRVALPQFPERVGELQIDRLDGVTVFHPASERQPMWWFNLRASNTEPLLRLNAEGADEATMVAVRDRVLTLVRGEST